MEQALQTLVVVSRRKASMVCLGIGPCMMVVVLTLAWLRVMRGFLVAAGRVGCIRVAGVGFLPGRLGAIRIRSRWLRLRRVSIVGRRRRCLWGHCRVSSIPGDRRIGHKCVFSCEFFVDDLDGSLWGEVGTGFSALVVEWAIGGEVAVTAWRFHVFFHGAFSS